MQNKELLSHLQQLMGQLAQIQTLQQTLVGATPTIAQATPISDSKAAPNDQLPLLGGGGGGGDSGSPPLPEDSLLPKTSTSTLSSDHAHPPPLPPSSDMSLGLDFNLGSTGPATNDPFVPQALDTQPSS